MTFNENLFDPETIFLIFVNWFFLSPGFILSGEYPQKKSVLNFKFEPFSSKGLQIFKVVPGKTVDSKTTIDFFFKIFCN